MPDDENRSDRPETAKPDDSTDKNNLKGNPDAAAAANRKAADGDRVEKTPNPGHPV
ncbi:hypothetical protein [Azospirillum rugosum]|uniref:Uncharacterized protein n=1 Tax=Azospirillum rugosum TaxID=416170 RepID=A0ABS4SX90_9PROT|nr:hypothetical protein [Azospirillum rugosum]MBP2297183.1 hypothetical protein [Azospirillum rugosum]MDQ0530609.1 hypothetical protein [Azospirillum rugosum]